MSKKFNIHDWQAKQRQKRLTENMHLDADEFERENLEFDIKRYIGQVFASWMSPSNPPFSQEYAKPPYIDKLAKGIVDYITNRYKTRNEHHDDENFPGKDLSAWDLLDKMKSGDKELYNKVEDFMRAMGGESSQANNSMWTSTSTTDDLTDTEEEEERKVNWRDFRENTTGKVETFGKFLKGKAEELDKKLGTLLSQQLKGDQINIYGVLHDFTYEVYKQGQKEAGENKEKEKAPKAKPSWRDFRENTTGTGASVGAGAGEAFATPKAFKKKRK